MPEANNEQMQQYADERIRPRAEQFRALLNALRDDKLAITDVYDRADGGEAWTDSRNDGPPRLLASQDILTFNTIATLFLKVVEGTESGSEAEINGQRAATIGQIRDNWAVFQSACVRPVGDPEAGN